MPAARQHEHAAVCFYPGQLAAVRLQQSGFSLVTILGIYQVPEPTSSSFAAPMITTQRDLLQHSTLPNADKPDLAMI